MLATKCNSTLVEVYAVIHLSSTAATIHSKTHASFCIFHLNLWGNKGGIQGLHYGVCSQERPAMAIPHEISSKLPPFRPFCPCTCGLGCPHARKIPAPSRQNKITHSLKFHGNQQSEDQFTPHMHRLYRTVGHIPSTGILAQRRSSCARGIYCS